MTETSPRVGAVGDTPRVAAARGLAQVVVAALLLMLLCFAAGRPQPFSDTRAYYALGQEFALSAAPGDHREASAHALRGRALPPVQAREQTRLAYTVAASRSPYWSVLFYLAATLGTTWLVVGLQALAAAAVLWIALGALAAERAFLPILAALALASSLPVEVMFLMPDLFAGLAIVSALALAAPRAQIARWEKGALWLCAAAGALFHASHLMTLTALGLATLAAGWRRPAERRAGAAILAAAAMGLAGALAYPAGVKALRHEPIYAPPFLSARLIADGPGRALLREDCRANPDAWGWCPYAGKPLADVNVILWERSPASATFQAADYGRRVRIIGEQGRFAAAVIRRFPGEVAANTARNVGQLFLMSGTEETLADRSRLYRDPAFATLADITPGARACAASGSCASRVPIAVIDGLIETLLLASLGVIAWRLARDRGGEGWWRPALFVFAALTVNAAVCGAISGAAQRYQSRVLWIVPLLAGAMLAQRPWRGDRLVRREASQG